MTSLELHIVHTPQQIEAIRSLFRQYQEWLEEDICFAGFETELSDLPKGYDLLLLATWDQHPCGCCGLKPYPSRPQAAEIKRLYVLPEYQNKHIATRLMTHTLDRAKSLGYQRIVLETLSKLTNALKLYEQLGFQPFCGKNENIHYLEKNI